MNSSVLHFWESWFIAHKCVLRGANNLIFYVLQDNLKPDFGLDLPPPPPLQINLSPRDEVEEPRSQNFNDHSDDDDGDDGSCSDEAGPSGKIEFRIHNISKVCRKVGCGLFPKLLTFFIYLILSFLYFRIRVRMLRLVSVQHH